MTTHRHGTPTDAATALAMEEARQTTDARDRYSSPHPVTDELEIKRRNQELHDKGLPLASRFQPDGDAA